MTWWHYLLLVNLYLILFFGFYALLLRRETFFQLNRIYLVGTAVLSFILPLVQVQWVKQWFITEQVRQTIYQVNPQIVFLIKAQQQSNITLGQIIAGIYFAGAIVFGIKLLWQLIAVKRLLRQKPEAAAWSFFKKIKVDENMQQQGAIMAHEQVHARQWHSADILLVEAIVIINWFNPVVYLCRKAIKHIHEYIADSNAINEGYSKSEYAMLLLSQTFNVPTHNLTNTFFNNSMLKQRIWMLQKSKSRRVALVKYGFSAPLFILMLALSSATISNSSVVKAIQHKAERVLDAPAGTDIKSANVKQQPNELNRNRQLSFAGKLSESEAEFPREPALAEATDNNIKQTNEVFTSVEQVPEFEGGMEKFYRYIAQHIRYPKLAYESNVQGRAIITFVVEKDGSLSNIHSLRDPGAGLGDEAIRVMAQSPRWMPGRQNGKTVRVQYTVPILFTLQDEDKTPTDTLAAAMN
ncbi:M56 family metallopeptidase [Mucilaginibacter sp. Bleaf8]|uniref:M56 family metallopeptidase n=1 Tax=Mucilaginibacter sp. Bleaf8 TaxID=2834430 RepID=UPI001BCF58C7|nr:M56 family metallopeptidase [Mucilaginibacter sp. Bleaf8]MBS7566618.1 M56 family metallopeptidase [Mucilaginibacter sp. Bleaf8]